MKRTDHCITKVEKDSIGEELGLETGDVLLAINDTAIEDVFDYHYLINDEYIELLIRRKNQEEWILEVEKEYNEDLGLEFANSLMDEYHSCSNHCIFCFIDQMPPGMRETLYFKDDDSRLSFLQGNYITLTNMKESDLERVIHYHLAPINVSVHTTNPELRKKMLGNRFAGDIMEKLIRLRDADIPMNGQIVLCKNWNDGAELERTLEDLLVILPAMQSLSVVPVGISKYREGLCQMDAFTKEDAREVLQIIHKFQKICFEKYGIHFVHASDEWYLLAKLSLPEAERYDGYLQYENGVGMLRLLQEEMHEELAQMDGDIDKRECTIATGALASPFLVELMNSVHEKFPNTNVQVIPIQNEFFGTQITVSGLITGQDLIAQLRKAHVTGRILIPCNMLRSGEDVFLDDIHINDVEEQLGIEISVVESAGCDLLSAILDRDGSRKKKRRQIYEQTHSSYRGKTERG